MSKAAFNPKTGTAPAARDSNLPLFFQKPTPLDAQRHAKAGLLPTQDITFATNTNSVLINAVEFFEVSRQYPIVFTQSESPIPAAIVGLELKNYFVDSKGQWKDGAYIPAYVRKYPFIFMDVPERQEFLLCVDEASPQYKENGGKDTLALFKDGAPSDVTKNALEFCTAYHNHHQVTRQFCEALTKADLLSEMRSDVKLSSGREIHLGGFLAIDEKKLAELPDATVLDFFKKGWMPLIYAALMSGSNWKRLADMAGAEEKRTKAN